jgi:hypothetical protein
VLPLEEAGHAVFEHDQPCPVFGQFDDPQVSVVARDLDATLGRVLPAAAR